MQSQGNHVPQYSSNPAPLPPPNQVATPAPSLMTPHGPEAPPAPALPPLPPPYQQLSFRPVSHQGHSFFRPVIHHLRPNHPPPNQTNQMGLPHSGHIPSPGMANAGQPYLIPHSSSNGNAALQYAPSHNAHGMRQSVLYPSAGLPIPPPPRSQIPYGVQPVHGQTGVMQRMPPPPTAGFSPITPSPHASFVHASITSAHSPLVLPPLPPPPASPPPLPPSPPPSSSLLPEASSSYFALDTIHQSETVKVLTKHVVKLTDQSMIAGATESNCEANIVEEGGVSSKLPTLMDLPSPPMKPEDDEVVRNIEVLSKFIAKVGPSFEDMARVKEAGNPKFAFLFGGEAGSMASIGYEYFQWMKRKCHMEHGECRSTHLALVPPEVESTLQTANSINKSPVHSPSASSDIEMEDDINHPDEEQATVGELLEDVSRDVSLSVKDDGLLHSSEPHAPHILKELSVIGKEDHTNEGQTSSEVAASISGDGCETYISVGKDLSEVHVNPPLVSAHLEEVSGICTGDGNPFKLIQNYASENSSEEEKALSSEDTRNTGKVDTHRDETTIFYLDSNVNRVCETEEDSAGKQPMSSAHKWDPTSGIAQPNSPNVSYRNEDADHNGLGELLESKAPTELKVDEFGRIIRDVTDSDSGEASYNGGRHLEKGRRDARRRSPQGNRRRKSRSPWRRRDRRSRSRSFSPRRRARSPSSPRHVHESGIEKAKRDGRRQVKECFDFLRGRCYRGSSCRYLHRDLSVGSSMKHRKGRQKQFDERSMEFEHDRSVVEYDEVENTVEGVIKHGSNLARGEAKHLQHVAAKDSSVDDIDKEKQFASSGDDKKSSSDGELTQPKNSLLAEVQAVNQDQNQQVDGLGSHLLENVGLPPPLQDFPEQKLPGNNHRIPLSGDKSAFELSQVNLPSVSSQMPLQDVGVPSAAAEGSSVCFNSPVQAFPPVPCSSEAAKVRLFTNQTPMSPSLPTESFGSFGDKSLAASNFQPSSSVGGFQLQPSVPPPSSLREISFTAPLPTDFQMNSSGLQIHLHTPSADYFSSHQPPLSDFYSTYAPPKPWTNPPPPLSQPPPRIDNFSQLSRQYPHDVPSQIGGFNPFLSHPVQPFSGNNPHLRPFSSEEYDTESSRDISLSSRFVGDTSGNSSLFTYQPSFSDSMGLKLPRLTHYNPFASTFEQVPANFILNSSVYRGETDSNYNSKSNFPSTSTIGSGSRQLTTPHNSNMSQVPLLPTSGGSLQMSTPGEPRVHDQGVSSAQQNKVSGSEQYDPIFDSIEPSFKKSRKLDPSHVDDSSSSLRVGSVFRPPDVEENNKQKDGQPASINCLDKDSVGETGMDEVGALENVSEENLIDTGGEIEIDQFQSPEKSKKKSKDSKSMKLFRIAIANFVKELLKPSWRQGNMSKEAFKTIVKKTVDKVSGAMQGRHVPKSQAKIIQYVESSERKLTKLVMGYVDKYVKA